jgi:hypothetical protein
MEWAVVTFRHGPFFRFQLSMPPSRGHRRIRPLVRGDRPFDKFVTQPLMIPLLVIVGDKLGDGLAEVAPTTPDVLQRPLDPPPACYLVLPGVRQEIVH